MKNTAVPAKHTQKTGSTGFTAGATAGQCRPKLPCAERMLRGKIGFQPVFAHGSL
jgi:hypothetical protein